MKRLAALLIGASLCLAGPALAVPPGGAGGSGPTKSDLLKRGYVCERIDVEITACKDLNGEGPPYVCNPSGQCIIG